MWSKQRVGLSDFSGTMQIDRHCAHEFGCLSPRRLTTSKTIRLKVEPAKALQLEADSAEKLQKMGVKVVDGVDKSGFAKAAEPIQDQLAKELGPHAVKILELVRNVK